MSFLNTVYRFFGAEDDELDNGGIVEYPVPHSQTADEEAGRPGEDNLIAMPVPEQSTVYVVKPERDKKGNAQYNLEAYTDFLQCQQAVIVDLNSLAEVDFTEAKRIVDFMTGAVRMVHGHAFEITTNVFIFAPHSVSLAGDPLKPVEVS